MQRLLVSVRGPNEAIEAIKGGAHIADVENPDSAIGPVYPMGIKQVRDGLNKEGYRRIPISTNIGEKQKVRSSSTQAALGVALAGADYIKLGFAGFNYAQAEYLGKIIVRTIKEWFPEKKVYPAVFPELRYSKKFNPLTDSIKLASRIKCDGILIDTYHKDIGKGLLDYYDIKQLKKFVLDLHKIKKEAWLAGSITKEQLPDLWKTGVDVICVRGAACEKLKGNQRFGEVKKEIVKSLINTLNYI